MAGRTLVGYREPPLHARRCTFGLPGKELPVFIQRHAANRLRERLSEQPLAAAMVSTTFIRESVEVLPHPDPADGGFLIEYRFYDVRLGYFYARVIEGRVVLLTFLFITMIQTPEGRRLHDLLKVSVRESDWHGLLELRTFVTTDVWDDPVLRAALEMAGLGSLRTLRTEFEQDGGKIVPKAGDLRRYLRLDGSRGRALARAFDGGDTVGT